jgi:uncharacterized DUF497 family protein
MAVTSFETPQGFEWDPEKAKANLHKHKVPFLMACQVFKDSRRIEQGDDSSDQNEER